MAEPLKNCYSIEHVNNIAKRCKAHYSPFLQQQFVAEVLHDDWQVLELKQRMHRIAKVLGNYLPHSYPEAIEIIIKVASDFSGLEHMCFADFVEQYGMKDLQTSLAALEILTENSTAEFAIRPFIIQHPVETMQRLQQWTQSPNKHIRRLASEGCRPRLPWAMALTKFKQDPTNLLPILLKLIDDESLYVRRSVANNLNDISKDHPDTIVDIAKRYLGKSKNIDWVIKHACRGLLKQGHKQIMLLFGYRNTDHILIKDFKVDVKVKRGEQFNFAFNLKTEACQLGKLRLEFVIDFMKANGNQAGKIFKIGEGEYLDQHKSISKYFSFKPISTRKYYLGKHKISLVINGVILCAKDFELVA